MKTNKDSHETAIRSSANTETSAGQGVSYIPPPLQFREENLHSSQYSTMSENNTTYATPAIKPVMQLHPGHDSEDQNQGGNAGGEEVQQGPYDPGEKNDRFDTEIADNEVDMMERVRKFIFMMRNYGPINMTSTTGTGGFRASYSPAASLLSISTICKALFHNGLTLDMSNLGNVKVNSTGHANKDIILQEAADYANSNLNLLQKIPFLSQFIWTDAEIAEGMAKLNNELKVVENVWSGQHSFYVNRDGWRDVRARVGVNISVTQGKATSGSDHLEIKTVKTPRNWSRIGATVYSYGNVEDKHNKMLIDDDKLDGVNKHNFLRHSVEFGINSDRLKPEAKQLLDELIIRFRDDNAQLKKDRNRKTNKIDNKILNKFRLVGRASSVGNPEYNNKLAQRRANAVANYLKKKGNLDLASSRIETENKGDEGADENSKWQRVDITIGSGEAQHTMSHEFGHVLGLKDEYAINPGDPDLTGTGKPTGTVLGHDNISTRIGAPNATAENTDSIMAMGNEVRGQQYSTFGEALRRLTNISEWRLVQ